MTAGRPVGMADTANAMAVTNSDVERLSANEADRDRDDQGAGRR